MNAPPKSPRAMALIDVQKFVVPDLLLARHAVDAVFYRLTEPDRVMLESGAAELEQALPKGNGKAYARNLAAVVWRAMLEAAR